MSFMPGRHAVIDGLLAMLSLVIGSCLVTLMGVFLGAGLDDLGPLLAAQAAAAVVAAAIALLALSWLARGRGMAAALGVVWACVPGWLVFAFCAVNTLVAMGELAFYMVARTAGREAAWHEHAPLACALAGSVAFCMLYALKHAPRR